MSFAAFLSAFLFNGSDFPYDRNKIEALKKDEEMKKKYLKKIEENPDLKSCWEEIKKTLDTHPIGILDGGSDRVRQSRTGKVDVDVIYWEGCIQNLNDWSSMIEF